jgi:N-acetylmuramic acid 6-phosphate etherase
MSQPPTAADRGHLLTEGRLDASLAIDMLDTLGVLTVINDADRAVPEALHRALPAIAALVDRVATGMKQGGRLLYIGAGTSGRLGVLDASECPPTFQTDPSQIVGLIAGGDTSLRKSSEGREDEYTGAHAELQALQLTKHDTLVGIAAGGTTPYVWGSLDYARQQQTATALLTCVPMHDIPAPPRFDIDHAIELLTGPEVITGSTRLKAGTATKLALNMISTATMIKLGKVWGHLMVDLRATNAKLRDRAVRILTSQTHLSRSDAEQLLDQANGHVKLALVMHLKQADRNTARQLLDQHNHQLTPLLGPPR